MNVLDREFAEFQKLPTEEKIRRFERNGHLFDMIIPQQLNREILDEIYIITTQLRAKVKKPRRRAFPAGTPAAQARDALLYSAVIEDLSVVHERLPYPWNEDVGDP